MTPYKILLHPAAFDKAENYRQSLLNGQTHPGKHLEAVLSGTDLSGLETVAFIELLLKTKRPWIYAESAVVGNGTDWLQAELSILGDISIAVPVTVFDNGQHASPQIHPEPFRATLLYVPGALLLNGKGQPPADWHEIVSGEIVDTQAYYALYERRLLPGFVYANRFAEKQGQSAFITIPGLGCGQFAGKFHRRLGAMLRNTLIRFLESHAANFPHIQAVYYDPYKECRNERIEIGHIAFFVRPLTHGNTGKSQLCLPQAYEENGDDFSHCQLFSFVAWDHVSWPGNDFYIGNRETDDGVKAAATDSMLAMTGIEGAYNPETYSYAPPRGTRRWRDVVLNEELQIKVDDNLMVLPEEAKTFQ